MKTAVVILNWNTKDYLERFLPGLLDSVLEEDAEVIVADSASTDGSMEMMQAFCDACISGVQPEGVLRQAYYGSILSILGDEAMLQNKILEFPEKYRLD